MSRKMKKCKICGQTYDENQLDECSVRKIMIQENMCFSCAFWTEKMRIADENTFVVNHVRYHGSLIDKSKTKGFIGFGGANFYVKFNDGEIKHYNNVWCQGDVPQNFWDKIPDNAEIITKEQYELLSK